MYHSCFIYTVSFGFELTSYFSGSPTETTTNVALLFIHLLRVEKMHSTENFHILGRRWRSGVKSLIDQKKQLNFIKKIS
jgi:hypothetical protein